MGSRGTFLTAEALILKPVSRGFILKINQEQGFNMTTDEFHRRVVAAVGTNMPMLGRKLFLGEERYVHLKYTEIETFDPFEHKEIDYDDGQEWITVFVYDEDGSPPVRA